MFSSITTIASPRPFVTIDGRDINLDNITGDDYIGGTTDDDAAFARRVPANDLGELVSHGRSASRAPDLRSGKTKVSVDGRSVQPVQLEQQPVVRRHAVHRDGWAGCLVRRRRRAHSRRGKGRLECESIGDLVGGGR